MKIAIYKLALCLTFSIFPVFASETVKLPCPSPQYSVDPEVSSTTTRTNDNYLYNYKVSYKVTNNAMSAFVIPLGLKDFEIVSWSSAFKRCWKSPQRSSQPGSGFACVPSIIRPGETWTGNIVLLSKAPPGAWKYYVSSIQYRTDDKKILPHIEEYLRSPEGDEAFQEAALEQCGHTEKQQPFASTVMTGALIGPTGIPGISPNALEYTSRSSIKERMQLVLGTNHKINSTISVKVRSSGGRSLDIQDASVVGRTTPETLHCYERGIFAEVLENDKVVARQAWQVDAAPNCGSRHTLLIEVP